MDFNQLKDFLSNRMRMSHIYQPVMILSLLENKGRNSDIGIAKDILVKDESQIDFSVFRIVVSDKIY
jgi:ATP adenylyltransferase